MKDITEAALASKALRCMLAALIALASALGTLGVQGKSAYAAESANLTTGGKIHYGGYHTTWMEADGEMAYCADPQSATPSPGSYAKSSIDAPSGRNAEVVADLWFAYGSPGFDASLWPDKWYDGTEMTASRYAACAHILVSDTYTSDGSYALYGCNADFKSWARKNVIGFGADGSMINSNATGRLIAARTADVPSNFEAFQLYTGAGTQIILSFKYTPYGNIDLVKVTANEEMCEGNPLYSVEGAVYTVYRNSGLTDVAGSITTDGDGWGILEELEPGDYWVKETKQAPGHAIDPTVYPVKVASDETARVNGQTVSDIPQSDPVGMLVGKVDADTGESRPQGDATLEGALFTVRYFAGDYTDAASAEASGEPSRTWVFETDVDGFAYLSDEYKHSGDPLYYQTNGDASIPLGTVLIQETRAPQGYNLDDGHGGDPKVFCVRITPDGAVGESVYTYNTPKVPDTVKRGDFRLVKEVPVTVYDEPDGDMPQEVVRVLVPGVKFELYNDSENAVLSPVTGKLVEPGDRVCTITVDDNGLATTKDDNASVNGWSKPADWTGALAYGTYRVHEVIPQDVADAFKAEWGKTLLPVEDWKTTIREEGQYLPPQLVNDHIPQTPLKVVKVDAETGGQVPLPVSFQLEDQNGDLVTYTSHYPVEETIDTWTANERGELTLPMLLEEGDYTLKEVQAPYGYVKELEGKAFHVGAAYNGWDDPLVIEFANMPQKATITVAKTDSITGDAVNESVYIVKAAETIATPDGTIRAHEGEIVATLTTGDDGKATTPEFYLGSYTVYEAKAKDGFALDVVEKTVALEYAGQDVSVYDHEEAVTDEPTTPSIKKVDALDPEKALAGAKFHVWNDEGTFDEELATNENGVISLAYAKHGSYHIQEVEAPDGYVIADLDDEGNPTVIDFKVNDQGMIEWDESGAMAQSHEFELENMPKTMKTIAADSESGTHESQAREDITIVDTIQYTGLIPGNEYTACGTLMDKATGEAALDDEGNAITSSTTFTAKESCGTVDVTFIFKGATLAGKQLVAFEAMEFEGAEYMVHADIDDVDQTVSVVDIATQARDGETGTNVGTIGENVKLIDTVAYTGLTPGNAYKLFTMLMDKETGNPTMGDDGLPIVGTTEFTPETHDGTIDVEIEIDTRDLAGHDIVFFEKLSDAEENIIATHEDIDDEGQTVSFPEPEPVPEPENPGKGYPKTGAFAEVDPATASVAVMLLCGAAGATYAYIRRARKQADAISEMEKEVLEASDED
ncbi:VaFE repeat-containing surface-anchored protein [Phoenicibacter congonensis]|uniref:VaFE repeat-containing surface-anchored protein n=1 Tax=Phoenicibacter congonensis TaxID=1944646 RepID=UPI0009A90E72|nr:VaFE repeat-containing surface-anchored protein [Phoenicibacter congonensis]